MFADTNIRWLKGTHFHIRFFFITAGFQEMELFIFYLRGKSDSS